MNLKPISEMLFEAKNSTLEFVAPYWQGVTQTKEDIFTFANMQMQNVSEKVVDVYSKTEAISYVDKGVIAVSALGGLYLAGRASRNPNISKPERLGLWIASGALMATAGYEIYTGGRVTGLIR